MGVSDGLVAGARLVRSPNCDARPPDVTPSLLLIHSISLPPGEFGGDSIERLFCNVLDARAHPYFAGLAGLRVSSHFLLLRSGELVQFVPIHMRAWHAGVSSWRGRSNCNDFSIGVELEGTDDSVFAPRQYAALATLVATLRASVPLRSWAAHSDAAPDRKTDPGPHFDWRAVLADFARQR